MSAKDLYIALLYFTFLGFLATPFRSDIYGASPEICMKKRQKRTRNT